MNETILKQVMKSHAQDKQIDIMFHTACDNSNAEKFIIIVISHFSNWNTLFYYHITKLFLTYIII
jgi:hypothetical protein